MYNIFFLHWYGFGMLLLGKTQKKHLGDLQPTVQDLPYHPQLWPCIRNKETDRQTFFILYNYIRHKITSPVPVYHQDKRNYTTIRMLIM